MGALEALMGIDDRLLQQERRGKVKFSKTTTLSAGDVQITNGGSWSSSQLPVSPPGARGGSSPPPTVLGPPL